MSSNLKTQLTKFVAKYPGSYTRSISKEPMLLAYANSFNGESLKEKIYIAINGEVPHNCRYCDKPTPFITMEKGYRDYCDNDCQTQYLRNERESQAIINLNSFGNLEYISGYEHSHSKVTVKNLNCGCVFDVTYLNVFTNPDYCPTHGAAKRRKKLVERNEKGLTVVSKEKRKQTFKKKYENELERVKLQNEILENQVLLEGEESIISFIKNVMNESYSKVEQVLKRFPKILKKVNNNYGDKFSQKLYNLTNRIYSEADHPKCPECLNIVNFKIASSRYSIFCSRKCAQNSELTINKSHQTQIEKYGSWHTSTQHSKDKKEATNIEKYGVPHGPQNKEIQQKIWKSQFRLKSVTLPSGKAIQLMGYEPQVLNYLLNTEKFDEGEFEFDLIPTFRYGDNHIYFPDFYLPGKNLIIEVKSQWTLDNSIDITKQKQESVEKAGYGYRLIVWDDSSKSLIESIT
jgi:hypothetical protein